MASGVKLTRGQEKQYQARREKFKLTRAEFLRYWQDVRRANRKGKRLREKSNTLYVPRYTTKFDEVITSRREFTKHRKSIEKVLSKNYQREMNYDLRQRYYTNLRRALGPRAESLVRQFKTLNNAQFKQFIDENEDLESLVYESQASKIIDFLDITVETIKKRVNNFAGVSG